jgi:Tfp pilus assembly protein PilW
MLITPTQTSSAVNSGVRAAIAGERGMTFVELLVGMAAAVGVFGATLLLLQSSATVQTRDAEWALVLQEDRAGLQRMARDIRQATKVEEAKGGVIYFVARIGGKSMKVKYDCTVAQSGTTYTTCVRLAAEEGKGLPSSGPSVVKDVTNGSAVFTYSPSSSAPTIATMKIELPAKGVLKSTSGSTGFSHKAVLENAAFMRNLYLAG